MRTNVDQGKAIEKVGDSGESSATGVRKTVGYIITEKKAKKLNFQQFADRCLKEAGILLKPIDLNGDLEEQGPFDAIIHKISDLLIQADHGNDQALQQCHRLQEYLDEHSSIRVLDPLPSIRLLCDRYLQYWLLRSIASHDGVYTPNFVDLISRDTAENRAKIARAGVTFPMVVKPLLSHGMAFTHEMAIVFNEEGLSGVETPCVAQSFVPHDAVLYKVFVLGNTHAIIARPSLKNFELGEQTENIYFDSHEVSKDGCNHHLSKMEDPVKERIPPDSKQIRAAVKSLRQCTGLSLFGLDVIVEKGTGKCFSIDINPFPSYDGVSNFQTHLLDYLKDQLEIGSGFRTGSAIIGKQTELMVEPSSIVTQEASQSDRNCPQTTNYSSESEHSASCTFPSQSTIENAAASHHPYDLVLWKPPLSPPSNNTQLIPINQALLVLEDHLSAYSMTGRSSSDVEIDYRNPALEVSGAESKIHQSQIVISRTSAGRGNSPADSGIGSQSESETSDSEKKMKQLALQATTTGPTTIVAPESGVAGELGAGGGSFFPSWKRIKRFYGIPKPPKGLGFPLGPASIDKVQQHHSFPSRTKVSHNHNNHQTSVIELKSLEASSEGSEVLDSKDMALEPEIESEPQPNPISPESKSRSDTIP